GLVTWLILDWKEKADQSGSNGKVLLILYLLALGVGFHLGTILIFPGFFFLALLVEKKGFSNIELWVVGAALAFFLGSTILHLPDLWMGGGLLLTLMVSIWLFSTGKRFPLAALAVFVLGLSVHLFLMIRAGHDPGPAINEADPSTWENLLAVLKREQYPARSLHVREASFSFQLNHFWGYLWNQFQMPFQTRLSLGSFFLNPGAALTALPLGLGVLGIWQQWRREKKVFLALFIILLVNSVGLILFLNFTNHEVRERDYFYTPGFYFLSLFIGLGITGLLEGFLAEKRGKLQSSLIAALLLLLSFGPLVSHFYTHDRSELRIARDYAWNMLSPLEENAVIFTNGDNDTFPLWYLQEVEGIRMDVRVVNLSLLNTDWYMRQLRDRDPVLPIYLDNDEIAEVATHYYQLEDGRILQPRDEIINRMMMNTQKEGWYTRPYYFAVTVPRESLLPWMEYLRMEGMVYRMTLEKGKEQVDLEKLRYNLEEGYIWRGIFSDWGADGSEQGLSGEIPRFPVQQEEPFYLNATVIHLIQNYAAAWSRLSIEMSRGDEGVQDDQEAVRAMERAWQINPEFVPAMLYLPYLYGQAGDSLRVGLAYDTFSEKDPQDYRFWARYAQYLETLGRHEEVVIALGRIIELNPDSEAAHISLLDYIVSFFPTRKNLTAMQTRLEEYLARNPKSEAIRERLGLLKEGMQAGQGVQGER
ncbi:MAG: DUF2723 domain-containing protein, partial [Candidatus Krumholzibacteria bacterium]|nr:DUF2723 domain-containing protein [Candidatus Krumholzibacteria bacterium]